ncbi:MAG: SUMF1/EgtB/PvdO family nonheme iron enzyme [Bacteroidota bacterium]
MASSKLLLPAFLGVSILGLFTISSATEIESNPIEPAPNAAERNMDSSINFRYATGERYLSIGRPRVIFTEQKGQLTCSVGWDKSWKDGDAFDAAWLFAKAQDKNGYWSHVKITHARQRPSIESVEAEVRPSPDGMGVLINRAENGQGDNRWVIDLAISPKIPREDIQDIKVFGLEMVHIPEGAYQLGTLKSLSDRDEVLTPGAGGAPYNSFFTYKNTAEDNYGGVFEVESESPIAIGSESGSLYWTDAQIRGTNTFSGIPEGQLSERFPKGYSGFFQMKYELSQGEYCDFLNTLTPDQQQARDISQETEFGNTTEAHRNLIRREGDLFYTDRPHRPCNFISWQDGLAYADWAGLRHMTELEFEKACRGPEPAIYREYVWGDSEISEPENLRFAHRFSDLRDRLVPNESGNIRLDGNAHLSFFSYYNLVDVCSPEGRFYDPDCKACRSFSGGDGGRGPVRKGIFGLTSHGDRIKAGATYYGAMEMGGNLQEPVVTVGHPNGRRFQGTHGDGKLTTDGQATNQDWIPPDGQYAYAGRGGAWPYHQNHARTADRFKGLRMRPNRRASHIGFRGVRSDF